jgi:hypothetical protein
MKILTQAAQNCKNDTLHNQMKCLAQAFLTHRQIGESEAIYRILPNLHLSESNIRCIYLANGFPETRSRFLCKITDDNHHLVNSTDSDIIKIDNREGSFMLKTSIHDRYKLRPAEHADMCLVEFAIYYEYKKSRNSENSESEQLMMKLEDGTLMKKRNRPLVLRSHQFKIDSQFHEYIYSELLFYLPWHNEDELHSTCLEDCLQLYQNKKEIIDEMKTKLFPHKNNVDYARKMMNLDRDKDFEQVGTNLDGQLDQNNNDDLHEGIHEGTFPHLDTNLAETEPENILPEKTKYKRVDISDKESMLESTRCLSDDQRIGFDKIIKFCKDLVKQRSNPTLAVKPPLLVIHGGAGAGKSKLIKDICQ